MKNTKGFTLVELLAVIVILAIVALVTTPAILNIVNDSREKGAQDKAWGTIDAVKLTFTQAQTNNFEVDLPTEVTFNADKTDNSVEKLGQKITVNGDKPVGGKVTISASGEITADSLKFTGNGTYTCKTNGTGTKMCCKQGDEAPEC